MLFQPVHSIHSQDTPVNITEKRVHFHETFDIRLKKAKQRYEFHYSTHSHRHTNTDELMAKNIERRQECWSGEPCVKGTRIRVLDVVHVVCGGVVEEEAFMQDYPYITQDMIDACLFLADKDRSTYLPLSNTQITSPNLFFIGPRNS